MRKKLLIGLALYLAVGVLFGQNTAREDYMCPAQTALPDDGYFAAIPEQDIKLIEDRSCLMVSRADRLEWSALATPCWLPLVIRSVAGGHGIPLGNIVMGRD